VLKKLKFYLDTSIFNFALSNRPSEELLISATQGLIENIKQDVCEGYISELVMREIDVAPELKMKALKNLVYGITLLSLKITPKVETLADKYVVEGLVPKKHYEDAVHIALASVYEMDAIVSWNFEHMIKSKTKKGVIFVNGLMGYRAVDIISPLEVDYNV
jgi:predicted nucleic acid-binding protein